MSAKPSKAALARHMAGVIEQDGRDVAAGDADVRIAGLRALEPEVPDPQTLTLISNVFANTDLVRDAGKISYVAALRASVGMEWQRAGKAFLRIGRLLLEAERHLSKVEYDSLIEGAGKLLPFGRTVAIQLRRVAQAVDSRRLPEDRCPASYSVAYALVTLPDAHFRLADERNLLRPDVKREEVRAFRAEVLKQTRDPVEDVRLDLHNLRKEIEALRNQRQEHLRRALEARQRMRALAALLPRRQG